MMNGMPIIKDSSLGPIEQSAGADEIHNLGIDAR